METSVLLSEDKEDTVILEEGRISKTPISTASGEHYFCTSTTVAGEKSMSQTTCRTTQLKNFFYTINLPLQCLTFIGLSLKRYVASIYTFAHIW